MSRAYLRKDPGFFERKAIDQGYPAGAYTALDGVLCLAESQPQRGRFRDVRLLKALLGPYGRWVTFLLEHGDLVAQPDGRLYVEGWDEWQEGDWKVGERVARIRGRKRPPVTKPTVTKDTPPTVAAPSDGGRPAKSLTNTLGSGGGDVSGTGLSPQPPADAGGSRKNGANPRANGSSPRQLTEVAKKRQADALAQIQMSYLRGEINEDEVRDKRAAVVAGRA